MDITFLDFPEEMQHLDRFLRQSIQSGCDLLRGVADYINVGAGKKLRPRLMMLAAHATADPTSAPLEPETLARAAAAIELVHVASLLHDDVIDKTSMRRGRQSVNALYGDDVAILMADLLYSQSFDLALSVLDPEVTRLICRATREMCESEIFQIEKRDTVLSRADYYHIIRLKTASLFAICAEIGGVLSGVSLERRQALSEFGRLIGMTYQIADDVLDYTATGQEWGKPRGNDLAQGKQTLPFVYVCEKATPDERESLLAQLRNGREISKVLPVFNKYGGIEHANDKAREFAEEAEALVAQFISPTAEEAKLKFHTLCRFAIERKF